MYRRTRQRTSSYPAAISYADAAVESLLPRLSDGDRDVGKSLVPVGGAALLAGLIQASVSGAQLARNPAFLPKHTRSETGWSRAVGYEMGQSGGSTGSAADDVASEGFEMASFLGLTNHERSTGRSVWH